MTGFARWCVVAVGVLLVVAVPVGWRAVPQSDRDIGPEELLDRVVASQARPWSGLVETNGTLELPVAEGLTDVGHLLADRTRMHAWWRSGDDWRVDRVLDSGETDLIHHGGVTIEWNYQHGEALVGRDPRIRLPRITDLLPPILAHRLLRDPDRNDVSRVAARRVDGVAAPGLRITPSAPQTSIDHVDLWADPGTGIPLRVEVYAGDLDPAFTTHFEAFSAATPEPTDTVFEPAPDVDVTYARAPDVATANRDAPLRPPPVVAGLPRSAAAGGAVGVYGTGLAQLVVIPMPARAAERLRTELAAVPGMRRRAGGALVVAGPLGVLLTGAASDEGWLVSGTVDRDTLRHAAEDLALGTTYVGDAR